MIEYLPHIQYIIDNYYTQLQARLKEEVIDTSVKQAIDILLACDPSEGKKLVDWLVKTYIVKGFFWEDVEIGAESKLAEVLGMYKQYFNQIPRDQRNIYMYESYGELYKLVEPYIPQEKSDETLGSREIKRRERAQALEASEVLYRSEDMIVAVPLTQSAAKWWGRGTKWCTAAEKNNYFDYYNRQAPLIVITLLNPGSSLINQGSSLKNQNFDSSRESVEKFQLWTDGKTIQFMDNHDSEVKLDCIKRNWDRLEPIIKYLVDQNGRGLKYIPPEYQTVEFCKQVIGKDLSPINMVSDKNRTRDFHHWMIDHNILAFGLIPERMITVELCKKALREDGKMLVHIPKEILTDELCTLAVKQCSFALCFVPRKMRTFEICKMALEGKGDGTIIDYVPEDILTLELCKLAIEQSGLAIALLPEKYRTVELYRLAVERDGRTFRCIPKELQTLDLCYTAIRQNGCALKYIPKNVITLSFCMMAIEQNGLALEFVLEKFKTKEMCMKAIEQNARALTFVPHQFKTQELCRCLAEKNPSVIALIPREHLTYDIYRRAFEKDQSLIKAIPLDLRTPEILQAFNRAQWSMEILEPLKQALEKSNTLPNNVYGFQ